MLKKVEKQIEKSKKGKQKESFMWEINKSLAIKPQGRWRINSYLPYFYERNGDQYDKETERDYCR